jgi:hypothetical protein
MVKKATAKAKSKTKAKAKPTKKEPTKTEPAMLLGRPVDDLKRTPHRTGEPDVRRVYGADRFPGCNNLPVHLVTLQLDAIPTLPAKVRSFGALPVVYSNCESCDAWMLQGGANDEDMTFRFDKKGRLVPANPDDYADCCQEGSTIFPPKKLRGLELVPPGPGKFEGSKEYPVRVGGEPRWVQSDSFCVCPECDQVMETFVAQIRAIRLGCGDQDLYVFVCTDCHTTGIVSQCT